MSDQDVDDVAFLTGTSHAQITHSICQSSPLIHNSCDTGGVAGNDSPTGQPQKKTLYENNGVATCSHNRALCIATIVFALLFTIAIIIAFTGPQSECTCAGEKPPNYVGEESNLTRAFIPKATNGQIFPWNSIRLPTTLKPSRYNLTIHPNLTTLEVRGQISIEFHCDKETNFIVLHGHNLTILDKIIQDRRGHNLTIVKLLEYIRGQQIYIEIKEKFKKKHNYTLKIRFNTKLHHGQEGFYITGYTGADGEKRYLAATHFQPTFARTAFPCFDEPHFKAKFKLTIFRDRFHIALFNTPVVNTDDLGFYMGTGLLRDDFQETVEISTYLIAFVICDYTNIRNQTERGVSVSVYSTLPSKENAKLALNSAVRSLEFFEDFFGIPYSLPKLDLVSIPAFSEIAMENWGLITYRETSSTSLQERYTSAEQWITTTITHQIIHQWLGNLVTMKWWTDLWLYEGLTTYLEYLGVNNYFSAWKMMDQFMIDKIQVAMDLDALVSSHPINIAVRDPYEIEDIFDTISYSKGAAIIHMLSNFLPEYTLQNGLNSYLSTYKYNVAETKDLWNILTESTNHTLDVKTIMETWTEQMGFPLITLTLEGREIVATQKRFLLSIKSENETSLVKTKYDYKWYVPLTYITNNDSEINMIWMNLTQVRFEAPGDLKWIKANVNQSGFYRVMYEADMWQSLITLLKNNHTMFSAADRANLIDDAFTLCRAGILNATIPLELSAYLVKETDYLPWGVAIKHFKNWARRMSESLPYKLFLSYMRNLLRPITKYVGWKDSNDNVKRLLRRKVLSAAVLCELNETIAEAKTLFQKWMISNETIDPNLKEVVFSAGIKFGGMAEWQFCWNTYNSTPSETEKKLLLKALGQPRGDPWLLQRYLIETLDKNSIRSEDVKIVLAVVAANPEGKLLAWRHLKAYWPTMHSMFGNSSNMMGSLISAVTAHLSTPYDYYEVTTYFNGMNIGSASRTLEQSLEIIQLNINWLSKSKEDIYTWLRKNANSV
ncbi:endoplasmic reticulum aminopeptidase 1-like isoform X2 [Anthonomus grandis grandis]|uniref:endoplasmic reticulum aminopeptidase 1-like isoform X2 n=1 Tax=Anthonomus grandis grandis TaxID=2921223 RepID=UPI002166B0AF|nr:endoplasmic reticulum aminopeptidase 1-like isoform X2 [Anthonomus grandis grandis]